MDDLPQIIEKVRFPIQITIHPYLMDHHVEKRAVLPAVETMELLATACMRLRPDRNIAAITRVQFDRFLYIPRNAARVEAFCDIMIYENNDITAELFTKIKSKKTPINRIKSHAVLTLPGTKPILRSPPKDLVSPQKYDGITIDAGKIYGELIPFGPAYQNIRDGLFVSKDGAQATIMAPIFDGNNRSWSLGSPFPLDAAFHCACVWSQRYVKVIAFPVGIESRIICRPTQPGVSYRCHILPVQQQREVLIFDIWILNNEGGLFESISGLSMRDVSGGRTIPPPWVINPD